MYEKRNNHHTLENIVFENGYQLSKLISGKTKLYNINLHDLRAFGNDNIIITKRIIFRVSKIGNLYG
jgi:hypothetical protein